MSTSAKNEDAKNVHIAGKRRPHRSEAFDPRADWGACGLPLSNGHNGVDPACIHSPEHIIAIHRTPLVPAGWLAKMMIAPVIDALRAVPVLVLHLIALFPLIMPDVSIMMVGIVVITLVVVIAMVVVILCEDRSGQQYDRNC